jgi:hypothetical protein
MRFCATCGRPEAERGGVCSGCGGSLTRFAPRELAGGSASAGRAVLMAGKPARIALVILVVLVLTVGAWAGIRLASRHQPSAVGRAPITAPAAVPSTEPATGSSVPSSPTASPTASSPSAAGITSVGPLAVTAAAERAPEASAVASFINSYFSAINAHDYTSYLSLLSPPLQRLTQAEFDSGYPATVDSHETLLGISAAGGAVTARVTFTSHQRPDAADHFEGCTKWRISLFLEQGTEGYVIGDHSPPGYHAGSAPCR